MYTVYTFVYIKNRLPDIILTDDFLMLSNQSFIQILLQDAVLFLLNMYVFSARLYNGYCSYYVYNIVFLYIT